MLITTSKGANTLTRRRFLSCVGGIALTPAPALADFECTPPSPMGRQCWAGVNVPTLMANQVGDPQEQSQWCWAACISMVFRYHGFRVSQSRIVQETFGRLVNMPAGSGATISQQINRPWVDDQGRQFTSRLTAAFDFDHGVNAIDNAFIATTLANNKPIILGARTHAIVLIRTDYIAGGPQPIILAGTVIDPWPGKGVRALDRDELVVIPLGGSLRYIAALDVG